MAQCQAIAQSGEQCRLQAGPSGYCHIHDPERIKAQEEAEREHQAKLEETERQRQETLDVKRLKRKRQLEEITQAIAQMQSDLLHVRADEKLHRELSSVVDGLYIEIDKLTKKAPAEQVTPLALDHINEVIKDTKTLIKDDRYIQALQIFVPAGDLPQLRDALLVVSRIKKGLERVGESYSTTGLQKKLYIARAVRAALEQVQTNTEDTVLLLSIGEEVDLDSLPDRWIDRRGKEYRFNFDYLDLINIPEHFSA